MCLMIVRKQDQSLGYSVLREGKIISLSKGGWKDGPFNETKEVIVGYYHILADDLDDAVAIAKGNPEFEYGTTARIEVRPIKTKEESTGFVYPKTAKQTGSKEESQNEKVSDNCGNGRSIGLVVLAYSDRGK